MLPRSRGYASPTDEKLVPSQRIIVAARRQNILFASDLSVLSIPGAGCGGVALLVVAAKGALRAATRRGEGGGGKGSEQ
jgi:hypothetical protein